MSRKKEERARAAAAQQAQAGPIDHALLLGIAGLIFLLAGGRAYMKNADEVKQRTAQMAAWEHSIQEQSNVDKPYEDDGRVTVLKRQRAEHRAAQEKLLASPEADPKEKESVRAAMVDEDQEIFRSEVSSKKIFAINAERAKARRDVYVKSLETKIAELKNEPAPPTGFMLLGFILGGCCCLSCILLKVARKPTDAMQPVQG